MIPRQKICVVLFREVKVKNILRAIKMYQYFFKLLRLCSFFLHCACFSLACGLFYCSNFGMNRKGHSYFIIVYSLYLYLDP